MTRVAYLMRPNNFRVLKLIFHRHLLLSFRNINEIIHPLLYFLIASVFFKIAIGNTELSQEVLVGIISSLNVLALLLTYEVLLLKDYRAGFLEQIYLIGNNFSLVLLSKYLCHLIIYSLTSIMILPLILFFFNLAISSWVLIIPSLFLLNAVVLLFLMFSSSLLLGSKSNVLLSMIVLVFILPALIFATLGMVNPAYLGLLLSLLLFLGPVVILSSKYLVEIALEDK